MRFTFRMGFTDYGLSNLSAGENHQAERDESQYGLRISIHVIPLPLGVSVPG